MLRFDRRSTATADVEQHLSDLLGPERYDLLRQVLEQIVAADGRHDERRDVG